MLQNIALQNLQILLYNRKCERLKNWYTCMRKKESTHAFFFMNTESLPQCIYKQGLYKDMNDIWHNKLFDVFDIYVVHNIFHNKIQLSLFLIKKIGIWFPYLRLSLKV